MSFLSRWRPVRVRLLGFLIPLPGAEDRLRGGQLAVFGFLNQHELTFTWSGATDGDKIVLGPVDIVPNQNYGVRMEVQNFLGYRDRAWWNFSKSCKPVPTIQIAGDANLFVRSTQDVMLAGDAFLSVTSCACRGVPRVAARLATSACPPS